MAGHTPGPWEVGYDDGSGEEHITGPDDNERIAAIRWGCSCCQDTSPLTPKEQANARLIAAAPDLLAALKGLFENCAMIHRHWGDNDNQREASAAVDAARAAIAKAKGE